MRFMPVFLINSTGVQLKSPRSTCRRSTRIVCFGVSQEMDVDAIERILQIELTELLAH